MKIIFNIFNHIKILIVKAFSSKRTIYMKCPYQKFECTEYDSGSATLLTSCKDCPNYNNGIVCSKF